MTKTYQLSEVCEITMGQAPAGESYNTDGIGLPLIAGAGDFGDLHPAPKKFTTEVTRKSRKDDIVLGIRASIGEKVWADKDYCLGRGVAGLRPRKGVDRNYLWHWLTNINPELLSRAKGATFKQVNKDDVGSLKIVLPTFDEQCRIATILDKAESLRMKRREALVELDKLAQAIFIEIFGDPISNPMGWDDSVRLGEVADVVSGITKGRKLNGKQTRAVPYLAVSNVQDMRLNLDVVKVIEVTEEEVIRYALRPGDLLLTEGGDPDKLGRGTLWSGELPECIHQNHVFRVRATSEQVTPCFLNWLIGSVRGKRYFLKSAKQTTGIASINMTQLRNFPLLLPPIEAQRKFEMILSRVRQQKEKFLLASQQVEAAFASIQHRAFQGTL